MAKVTSSEDNKNKAVANIPTSKDLGEILKSLKELEMANTVMTNTLSDLVKSIKAFSKIKIDKDMKDASKNLKNVQKAIKNTGEMLNVIVKEIVNMVKDIDTKALKDCINLLVKGPDTITENIDAETLGSDGKTTLAGKIKKVTKSGQMGLLDIINTIFGIFGQFNTLKMPNFIKTYVKLKANFWVVDLVMGMIANSARQWKVYGIDAKEYGEMIDTMSNVLTTIFGNVQFITDNSKILSRKKRIIRRGQKQLQLIFFGNRGPLKDGETLKKGEILGIMGIAASIKWNKSYDDNMAFFSNFVKQTEKVVDMIVEMSIKILLTRIFIRTSLNFLNDIIVPKIVKVAKKITEENKNIDSKAIKDFTNNVQLICDAVKELTKTVGFLILLELAGLAAFVLIPGLWAAELAIKVANNVITRIASAVDNYKDIANKLNNFRKIVVEVGLILGMLVLIGATAIIGAPAMLFGLVVFTVAVFALVGILKVLSIIAKNKNFMIGVLSFKSALVSLMAALVVIVSISLLSRFIDILAILKFAGAVAILTGLIVGLGFLVAGTMGVGAVLVFAGIATMIAMAVALVSMALSLVVIQAIMRKIDMPTVEDNISKMIDCYGVAVDELQNIGLFAVLGALAKISMLTLVGFNLMAMASMLRRIGNLEIKEFDDNGRPTGRTVKMTSKDFVNAAMNGIGIVKIFMAMVTEGRHELNIMGTRVVIDGIAEKEFDSIDTKVKRKFRQLNKIVKFISRMCSTVQKMANLEVTDFDDNGYPTGKTHRMNSKDIINASLNGISIVQMFAAMMDDNVTILKFGGFSVGITGIKETVLEKITTKAKRKFRQLNKIVGFVSKMTETIGKLSGLEVKDFDENGYPTGKTHKVTSKELMDASLNGIGIVQMFAAMMDDNTTIIRFAGNSISITGIPETALDNITRKAKRKFEMLNTIVGTIGDMAKITVELANGTITDSQGKAITINEALQKEADIIMSIQKLIGIYQSVEAALFPVEKDAGNASGSNKGFFGKAFDFVKGVAKSTVSTIGENVNSFTRKNTVSSMQATIAFVGEAVSSLVKIHGELSTMGDGFEDKFNSIGVSLTNITRGLNNVTWKEITMAQKRSALYKQIIPVIEDFVNANLNPDAPENIGKSFEYTGNFITKLNSVSDSKLKQMATISSGLATFATKVNGNFDKLADTMNEKIVTAIEKLDKTLKEVKETLDNIEINNTSSASAATTTVSNAIGAAGDKNKDADNSRPSSDDKYIKNFKLNGRTVKDMQNIDLEELVDLIGACIDINSGKASIRVKREL